MRYWTYSEIKDKVRKDLDLEGETFITADELLGYCNEAIDEAEAEIHSIYEDYFLTSSTLSITSGTAAYSLPSDIYANKIRAVIYANGTIIYPIKRIKDWNKFQGVAWGNEFATGNDLYQYIIKNVDAATGMQIVLVPAAQATDSTSITIWYIRNAEEMEDDNSECDIPEFVSFIIEYMKMKCYEKEGHPNVQLAMANLERQRKLMQSTLRDMVPDGDNEVEMDTRLYEDMN